MPVDIQYQTSAQLEFIKDALLEWVQLTFGGTVEIVHNVSDLWVQSFQDSQSPMVYVCPSGEEPWSSNANIAALTHRVNRSFIIRVKQGRGYTSVRGDTVLTFMDAVEHIRDLMRSMLGISEDAGIDYNGWKPVRLGDQVLDCVDLFFGCKNDLPTIVSTPDE